MPSRHYSDFRNKNIFTIIKKIQIKTHNVEHYTGMTTNIQCKSVLTEEKMKRVATGHITVSPYMDCTLTIIKNSPK